MATVEQPTDPEDDEILLSFEWRIGAALQVDLTGDTVVSSRTSRGQTWEVTVIADDGHDHPVRASASATIVNSAPTAPRVPIVPVDPDVGDELECQILEEGEDVDEDEVTHSFSWTVGDEETDYENNTVPSDQTSLNEEWRCIVTPHDGFENGATGEASVIVAAPNGSREERAGSSCLQILEDGFADGNDLYWISFGEDDAIQVYCDMETDDGGWTLFGNIVSGGFSYGDIRSTALGTAITDGNFIGSKPAETEARIRVSGEDFSFDLGQQNLTGAWTPSTDSAYVTLVFDDLLAEDNATITFASRPIYLQTSESGYEGGYFVDLEGAAGSVIDEYTYSTGSGCSEGDTNIGLLWVITQETDAGFTLPNTMEIGRHSDCTNMATDVFATRIELYWR